MYGVQIWYHVKPVNIGRIQAFQLFTLKLVTDDP